jgi:hypothetical protein
MDSLTRSLIEKAGYANGFEVVLVGDENTVRLASANHRQPAEIREAQGGWRLALPGASEALQAAMAEAHPAARQADGSFLAAGEAPLCALLKHAAGIARALPRDALADFQQSWARERQKLPAALHGTEAERLVRERIGQDKFRAALMDYWGGACAATGVAVPEALRASHIKPWAECENDAERLCVYNGLLLVANLDALFDKFFASFDEDGRLLVSSRLAAGEREKLGLPGNLRLRRLEAAHRPWLDFHRQRFFALQEQGGFPSPGMPATWLKQPDDFHG